MTPSRPHTIGLSRNASYWSRWRFVACLGCVACVWFVASECQAADPPTESSTKSSADASPTSVRRLIEQLGDERFDHREQATAALLQIGLGARSELERATRHVDREVRFRAERILLIVRKIDLEQRLEEFIEEAGKPGDYGLPAWPIVQRELGDTREIRRLYSQMVRSEPELLTALERGKQAVLELFPARVQEIQQAQQFGAATVSVGTIATILFAANTANAEANPQAAQSVYGLCYQPALRAAVSGGEFSDVLRKLLAIWIQRGDDVLAYQGMQLATQFDMKEGLVPALKLLKNANTQAQLRQYAILFVAKLGDPAHLELLEKMLDDPSPCGTWQVNNLNISTQLRDIALVAVLILHKKDPKQFGFERLQISNPYGFSPMTAGFENEEKRTKTFEKWRAFRTTLKDQAPAPKDD
ncbi:MAG: hypothetical protein U0939_02165 [Pirellulales bacterium]